MNTKEIFATFEPLLTVGIERIQKFNKPEPRDLVKIFGPTFNSICKAADVRTDGVNACLESFEPGTVTLDGLRSAIAKLTVKPAELIRAQNRQKALDAELNNIDDRQAPIAQRSVDSINRELWEIRLGRVRGDKDAEGRYTSGERIPTKVWERMAAGDREEILQSELDERECVSFELTH